MTPSSSPPISVPQPKRLLVIPLRFIGDCLLTLPLLKLIRQKYPDITIDVLVPPSVKTLFDDCPDIDTAWIAPASKGKLLATLQGNQYDTAILMRRSLSDALTLKWAGVQTVIGFDEQRFPPPLNYRRWAWGLDVALPFPELNTTTPQILSYAKLLSPLGIEVSDPSTQLRSTLWPSESDEAVVFQLLQSLSQESQTPYAVIHVTSASKEKAVPLERFLPSVKALTDAGLSLIALGAAGDAPTYDALSKLANIPIANWCGRTSLSQSAVVLRHSNLLLSLDSAPIHMAAMMGTPHIIGIYGPINHLQWQPFPYDGQYTPVYHTGLSCRPCLAKTCATNACRLELSSDAILEATRKHLSLLSSCSQREPALTP